MRVKGINHIAIIGNGMIGASLAVLFTGNGYRTTMCAHSDVQKGIIIYDKYFEDLVNIKLLTKEQVKKCVALRKTTTDYEEIADADFIFECAYEKLEVKHSIYSELEKHCAQAKVIASSTSAISIEDLVSGAGIFKDRLMVAHPYNPPHLVPFVEVVKSKHTAKKACDILVSILQSAGRKVTVLKKSAPGFIGNRLQHALYREAVYMVEEGIATPEDIDMALKYSFIPRYTSIGIFEHFDYAGLDLVLNIEDYLFPSLCNAAKAQKLVRDCYKSGNLGAKTGRGIYDWSKIDMDEFRKRASNPYLKFINWDMPD